MINLFGSGFAGFGCAKSPSDTDSVRNGAAAILRTQSDIATSRFGAPG
jgi:hypothetical protein